MKRYLSYFTFIILLTNCKDRGIKATFVYDYFSNIDKKEKKSEKKFYICTILQVK